MGHKVLANVDVVDEAVLQGPAQVEVQTVLEGQVAEQALVFGGQDSRDDPRLRIPHQAGDEVLLMAVLSLLPVQLILLIHYWVLLVGMSLTLII